MDEFLDIVDPSSGIPIGKTVLKSEAHARGIWHTAAHVWIYNDKNEVLLQLRSSKKNLFPGVWDVSVAGHVSATGNPEDTALREAKEELGLNLHRALLKKAFVIKVSVKVPDYLQREGVQQNNEFYHVYLYKLNSVPTLVLQEEEVDGAKFVPLKKLESDIHDLVLSKKYVPHGEYWFKVIDVLKKEMGLVK